MTSLLPRISFALALTLSLTACAQPETPPATQEGDGLPFAAEGEFCGGIAGIMCGERLICRYDGNYPDAGGTCIPE